MSELFLGYESINPASWVYVSSLAIIGLYFKFNRLLSVRNIDLILIVLLGPGVLFVNYGEAQRTDALLKLAPIRQKIADEIDEARQRAEEKWRSQEAPPNPEEAALPTVAEYPLPPDLVAQRARGSWFEMFGYTWLFGVGVLLITRMLLDPLMERRPLLEPNLSLGGLAWIGGALFIFLMANVVTSAPTSNDLRAVQNAEDLAARRAADTQPDGFMKQGPGFALIHLIPVLPTVRLVGDQPQETGHAAAQVVIAKIVAILSQVAMVTGIVFIGWRHFGSSQGGIGVAVLYLLLPYTAQMTGRVEHVLPAAMLVWAVALYRTPLFAGMFVGLAAGMIYYPLFLLPLWISFYWKRGSLWFVGGVAFVMTICALSLIFQSTDALNFWLNLKQMFGVRLPAIGNENFFGIWHYENGWPQAFRITVLVFFLILSVGLAFLPASKNLGTLLCCTGAVMIGCQFWNGYGGGMHIAWYLPMLLLTIFRPNLDDRVAPGRAVL